MDDIRRLNALRARARAGYYRIRAAAAQLHDEALREALEDAAGARWHLARAIDDFLTSQPWEDHSRLAPTSSDRLACLAQRMRASWAIDRDRQVLQWLLDDTAELRHDLEICRSLSWSLEISDLLTPRLDELRQAQRAACALDTRSRGSRPAVGTTRLAAH
ncbi:MAG: hypothetical protein MUF07_13330 [Steroidobacteraceae bacterium]|jgi:hypothetical protein|nr:hypothetical protein [Steroidobacteraceae bacterium]